MKEITKPFRFLPCIVLLVLGMSITNLLGQNYYKTPSGKKYHLETCHMVDNVSSKLVDLNDINKFSLGACKICKPNDVNRYKLGLVSSNVAQGEVKESKQCLGITLAGTRCKHLTKIANGYCYQHGEQVASRSSHSAKKSIQHSSRLTSSACGAKNKTGGYCKRIVKGGGRCYQHK